MGYRVAAIVFGLLVSLILGTTTACASDVGPVTEVRPANSAPLLIGDSITRGGTKEFQPLRPAWQIDGVPGRLVSTLPDLIAQHKAKVGTPRRLVIALGTNTVPGWSKQDYRDAVQMVPKSTQVLMVTPYVRRNNRPADTSRGSLAAGRTWHYAKWMRELDVELPNVCVVRWRREVQMHPGYLYGDGVHPRPVGKRAWARLIDTAIDSPDCQGFRRYL